MGLDAAHAPEDKTVQYCSSATAEMIRRFEGCFTRPGFRHFHALIVGWLLLRGTHTISRMLRILRPLGWTMHHFATYRFLTVGRWSLDALGHVVFAMFRSRLPQTVIAIVDDTVCEKTGRQIFGAGVHPDTSRSVAARGIQRFCFGHDWVVLAIAVPCPWDADRCWAVPVLFRLYRPKSRCPESRYKKRTEWARALIRKGRGTPCR